MATFTQYAGQTTAGFLKVNTGSSFVVAGGSASFSEGATLLGQLDFQGSSASFGVGDGVLLNLSGGVANGGNATITAGADALIIVPVGFNPASVGTFAPGVTTHEHGQVLTIGAGTSRVWRGELREFVHVEGSLQNLAGKPLTIVGGLQVAGGNVNLANNSQLIVEAAAGGISSGSYYGKTVIGLTGSGSFVQSGGSVTATSMDLANRSGASGLYQMDGGTLTTQGVSMGINGGAAVFRMSAGTFTGRDIGVTTGLIEVSGDVMNMPSYVVGNILYDARIRLGVSSAVNVTFNQSGGSVKTGVLTVGDSGSGQSFYNLTGGQLTANDIVINFSGNKGQFSQTAGDVNVTRQLWVKGSGTRADYLMNGGNLTAAEVRVDHSGYFTHTSGNVTCTNLIVGGSEALPGGEYNLRGGLLTTSTSTIGVRYSLMHHNTGAAVFDQRAGTHRTQNLYVGGGATYFHRGGSLEVARRFEMRGKFDFANTASTWNTGVGLFADFSTGQILNSAVGSIVVDEESLLVLPTGFNANQLASLTGNGVVHRYGQTLVVAPGHSLGVSATLTDAAQVAGRVVVRHGDDLRLNGGATVHSGGVVDVGLGAGSSFRFETTHLTLGTNGIGELNIHNSAANVTVSQKLTLGSGARMSLASGSVIHMTGSAFENFSTDPASMDWLAGLTLVFEGGPATWDPFEVAGEDLGILAAGFDDNFAHGVLQVGGANVGRVRLVDQFDNQPDDVGVEALYVHRLVLKSGSILDLNGLHLYYEVLENQGGTILLNGGAMFHVPEPGAAAVLLAGGMALLRRSRRRG